jgi:SAM-dependent methyltransferase
MTLAALKDFLRENMAAESEQLYGLKDDAWVNRAVENWFDEGRNYDRRWHVIESRRPRVGRVLDVAAGCGTFLLYGLNHGRDVTGIEPEEWKRSYYQRKIELCRYPAQYADRIVAAVGESLPFANESFDLVTTYQTLEHVADVQQCAREMLRVLRPGGVLYVRAPDYSSFFEPHYRVPMLPKMDRRLAERYLELLGRPLAGLRSLNWTTEREIVRVLRQLPYRLQIEHNRDFLIEKRRREVEQRLPTALRRIGCGRVLNELHQAARSLRAWVRTGREERSIDLWVRKLE